MLNARETQLKAWVLQGTLFIVIGLLGWFAIRPLYDMIQEEKNAIQKTDVLREYRGEQLKRLPELEKQDALIDERGKELALLLSRDELVGFIQDLEAKAKHEGVSIKIASRDNTLLESKTSPEPQKGKKPSGEDDAEPAKSAPVAKKATKPTGILAEVPFERSIRLTLTVTAPYAAMARFLHQVETMPYALDVIGLAANEADDEEFERYFGHPKNAPAAPSTPGADGATVVPSNDSNKSETVLLSTDIDLLLYTKD